MPPLRTENAAGRLARAYRERGEWRGVPLERSFHEQAEARGNDIALIDGATELSFSRLKTAVDRCATGLGRLGVGPGTAVAYMLPNWWEAAVLLLGTVARGAVSVPIVPFLRRREVGHILAETRPQVIAIPERRSGTDYRPLVRDAMAAVSGPYEPDLVVVRPETPARPPDIDMARLLGERPRPGEPVDATRLALVIYTSGSTAAPKGALHTHETLDAELASLRAVHGLGPGDRVLMPSPLTHISGVIHGVLAPALLGTSAVLMDRWDPGAALAAIERHRVTYMIGAPTFLQELLAHPERSHFDLSSLRLFSCGGASVPPELLRSARETLPHLIAKRVYGSSEFPTISTTGPDDARLRGLDSEGRALPGVELKICDDQGAELPSGKEGEIRARGPDCMVGYADPALNDDAFDEDGFLRTGDLGVVDPDGYLTVTGRVKDIIVRKGEKISAREVEDEISTHPGVAEVAVVPLPHPDSGEIACACLRLVDGATPLDLPALVGFLRDRDVTTRKLPEQLVICDSFPRAPSGKVHKKRLREEVQKRLADAASGR